MNTHDEREWQAQERALLNERIGADAAEDDALVARYRSIARALRQPPAGALPSNFAYEVARLAAMQPRPADIDSALEQWLVRALVGTMVLAAVIVTAIYGSDWLGATGALLGSNGIGGGGWIAALVACFAMTFGFGRLPARGRSKDYDSRAP